MNLLSKIENNQNIQFEYDKTIILDILKLYINHPRHYIKILRSQKNKNKYKQHIGWVYEKTDYLKDSDEFNYNVQTRLCWILNGKHGFEKCSNDKCTNLLGIGQNLKISDSFPQYCSVKCSTNDPKCKCKAKLTKKLKYGDENYVNIEKHNETISKKLKLDPEYWKKCSEKCKATKIKNGHDQNWNNRKKSIETYRRHCKDNPDFKTNQIKKLKATKLKKYGDENYTNPDKALKTRLAHNNGLYTSDEEKQKRRNTFVKNHNGLTSNFQDDAVRNKCIDVWIKKYGVNSPFKSKEIRDKIIQIWINEYNADHPWKSAEIIEKSNKTKLERYGSLSTNYKYIYDNITFDSSWELAIWIYCRDHNIKIIRSPKQFEYYVHNKKHIYEVDFEINGVFTEIKGDQFFDSTGKMICPYRYDRWNDEFYEYICEIYEAKHQCMVRNNVVILKNNDMIIYFKYIEETYGIKYLNQFRIIK